MESSEEIKLYIEKGWETVQQGRDILELGYYDVAISRAYYAMFYAATALLQSQGVKRKKHSGVQAAFAEYFVKTGLIEAEYSRTLGQTFRLRLDSDYEILPTSDEKIADDALDNAEKFVKRAEDYLNSRGYL